MGAEQGPRASPRGTTPAPTRSSGPWTRGRPRHRAAHGVRVLDRELDPAGCRRSSGIMALFVERLRQGGTRARRARACDCASSAAATARGACAASGSTGRSNLTAGNTARTLYVAFDYGGRAEILHAAEAYTGGGEEEFRSHLYAPDIEGPAADHPHGRRAAAVELPAVGVGLRRAVLLGHAVAGLRPRRVRAGRGLLRRSRVPVRGQVVPQSRRRRRRTGWATRRTRGATSPAPRSSTGARWLIAHPVGGRRGVRGRPGGTLFAVLVIGLGLVALHELYGLLDAVKPVRLAGFVGLAALVVAAHVRGPVPDGLAAHRQRALDLPAG